MEKEGHFKNLKSDAVRTGFVKLGKVGMMMKNYKSRGILGQVVQNGSFSMLLSFFEQTKGEGLRSRNSSADSQSEDKTGFHPDTSIP